MKLPELLERGLRAIVDHIGQEVRQKGIWRGTLVHRRKDGTTFPASSDGRCAAQRTGQGHAFRRRRTRRHRRPAAARSAGPQRAALGRGRAGGRRGARDQQSAADDHRLRRVDDRRTAARTSTRDLELVRQEATRAGQIVRNLLSFVRRGSPDRTAADLNQIANAIAQLREHHLANRNIVLRLRPASRRHCRCW